MPLGLLAGLALGVLTNVLQGLLPNAVQQAANSGAVWVCCAFAVGALASGRVMAAVAGALSQTGAVVGYYAYAEWGPHREGAGSLAAPLAWLLLGLAAGPLFGTAGRWWRRGGRRARVAGPALLGGVFLMEGSYYAMTLHYYGQAVAFLTVGAALALLLGRRRAERFAALGCAVAVTVPFLAALYAFGALSGLG